jgi:phosphoribosylanthranilate isomerase
MNIKVCGVTQKEQLVLLDRMGVDYAGLLFDSKNGEGLKTIISSDDLHALSLEMQIVGRFRNSSLDEIQHVIDEYRFNIIQIDSGFSAWECGQLSEQVELIKTLYLNQHSLNQLEETLHQFDPVSDYYCFDLAGGKEFPWNMPEQLAIEKPFFIGGSWLRPADAGILHRYFHPDFYGVDLRDPFEKAPGDKDTALIMSFMRSVHQVDN